MRETSGVHEKIRDMQDLFQNARPERTRSRGDEIKLVEVEDAH